jgi:uncharacterized protein (TIGR02466 family)
MGATQSPFESGSVASIFATPVWTFKPARGKAIAENLAAYLKNLRDADPKWTASGGAGVWQSRDDLSRSEELAELLSLVNEASRAAISLLQVECTLKITGVWGNISRGRTALHEHTHPNNFLSGVFYVRMPEGAGGIVFKDPRPQTRILRPRTLRDNPLNSLEFEYAATTGTLLLFPAWLEHGVQPGRTEEERISVAWNLMITGPLGSHGDLAYSEL